MLRFLSIGSGSSGNCYFLCTETDGLMIDCGVGVRTLKKYFHDYGLKLTDVHNILITHDHADHVKSVGSLSHDLGIPVYTTENVHQGIFQNWCVKKKIDDPFRRIIGKGETMQLGDFRVTSFAVPHDSVENIGFQVECQGVVFVIVTDCGHVTEEIKQYIQRANYLVIEANYDVEMLAEGPYPQHLKVRIASPSGHLSNLDCATAIAENASASLRHVWLCHLSEENNHPELARKSVEATLRSYGIVVGKEFELEVLKRKMPTGIYELV